PLRKTDLKLHFAVLDFALWTRRSPCPRSTPTVSIDHKSACNSRLPRASVCGDSKFSLRPSWRFAVASEGPQYREILRRLADEGVEAIVVGMAAAVIQGVPATTWDLDIVHRRTVEN